MQKKKKIEDFPSLTIVYQDNENRLEIGFNFDLLGLRQKEQKLKKNNYEIVFGQKRRDRKIRLKIKILFSTPQRSIKLSKLQRMPSR